MDVPIPFIDRSIDFTDPTEAAFTAVALVGGFAVFYLASFGGRRVSNNVVEAAGMNDDGDSVEVL